jgi:hypothetical protein
MTCQTFDKVNDTTLLKVRVGEGKVEGDCGRESVDFG